jgi:AcrR family transcriptional regulator
MSDSYHHGDLRRALLDAAASLLRSGGADALTLRALAEAVGVSRTAPYRHFADKADLLIAVATEGFERLRSALHAVTAHGAAGLEGFEAMGVAYIRFAVENPAHYRLMYGREALARRQVPALQAAADATYDELVALIAARQATGDLRTDDPEALAYVAWATVHGLASLLVDGQMEEPDDVDALARLTARTLLEGLASS